MLNHHYWLIWLWAKINLCINQYLTGLCKVKLDIGINLVWHWCSASSNREWILQQEVGSWDDKINPSTFCEFVVGSRLFSQFTIGMLRLCHVYYNGFQGRKEMGGRGQPLVCENVFRNSIFYVNSVGDRSA